MGHMSFSQELLSLVVSIRRGSPRSATLAPEYPQGQM